jgi:hypothetical protein
MLAMDKICSIKKSRKETISSTIPPVIPIHSNAVNYIIVRIGNKDGFSICLYPMGYFPNTILPIVSSNVQVLFVDQPPCPVE